MIRINQLNNAKQSKQFCLVMDPVYLASVRLDLGLRCNRGNERESSMTLAEPRQNLIVFLVI